MSRLVSKLAAVALGLGLVGLAAAQDKTEKSDKSDKKSAPAPSTTPAKGPDWSGYLSGITLAGEVVKADEKGFVLRVTQTAMGSYGRGRPRVRTSHEDVYLTYAEPGMVRWKALPHRLDGNGKKIPYTAEETRERKQPPGAPGYAAERTDLQKGYGVEVTLVRPKDVPASKAKLEDLKIKYVMILSTPPDAPAPGDRKGEDRKKKPAAK